MLLEPHVALLEAVDLGAARGDIVLGLPVGAQRLDVADRHDQENDNADPPKRERGLRGTVGCAAATPGCHGHANFDRSP